MSFDLQQVQQMSEMSKIFSRGGNMSISTGGVTMTSGGGRSRHCKGGVISMGNVDIYQIDPGKSIEFKYRSATSDLLETIFKTYLNYITIPHEADKYTPYERIRKIEKTITIYYPHTYLEEKLPENIKEDPQSYLKTLKKLFLISQEIFTAKINKNGSCLIKNRCFDNTLDLLHREILDTLKDTFDAFMLQGDLANAYETAKEMKGTHQGANALLLLVKHFLANRNLLNAVSCLNTISIDGFSSSETIADEDFTSLYEVANNETLLEILPQITKENIKEKLGNFLVNQLVFKKDWSQAKGLISCFEKAAAKGSICGKIVDGILNEQLMPLIPRANTALAMIPLIHDKYYERIEYTKIITLFFNIKDFDSTLNCIKFLNDKYYEREQYIKVIDYYLAQNNIPEAKNIIKKLDDKYYEREQSKKIIDYYCNSKMFTDAAEVIFSFRDNYYEKEAFINLFIAISSNVQFLNAQGRVNDASKMLNQAQQILSMITHKETLTTLKGQMFDCIQQQQMHEQRYQEAENVKKQLEAEKAKRDLEVKIQKPSVIINGRDVPPEFLCPITQDLMKDPVIADDGYSYERTAILEWFTKKKTSPMTNLIMESVLIKNRNLADAISKWQSQG
jgi:hypothetical protein